MNVAIPNMAKPARGGAILGSLAVLFAGSLATLPAAWAQAAPMLAGVVVDFDRPQGKLLRTERVNNFARASAFIEQRPGDVRFYNEQGLHGEIYRVWINDSVYDEKTGAYDYSQLLPYLTDASNLSDSILMNLQPAGLIQEHASPAQIKPVIQTIIRDLKQKFPKIKYVEAFNEPDYNFAKVIEAGDLYRYYVPFYEAVHQVNTQLRPEVPLQVGGPAFMQFNLPWLRAFFDAFEADASPDKRLDFISYHAYGYFLEGGGAPGQLRPYHFFKGDPSEVASQRGALDMELRSRGLDTNIPSFLTEMGIYPGPSFDDPADPRPDYLRQAAGMASLAYWYMNDPKNVPFNWVVRHRAEERKDQLVTRVSNSKEVPSGLFTPYGNMMLMMSRMKATRVAAVSDGIKEGKGVYAIAAKDATGLSVLLWNYQHTNTVSFRADLTLTHVPKAMRNGAIRETVFRIDPRTSNFFSDPQRANLQQIADRMITVRNTYRESIELEPNSLQLILLQQPGAQAATNVSNSEISGGEIR